MKDNVFFDTNVIVYLFDKSEEKKHKKAKALFNQCLQKNNSHISIQVINEFIVIASQKIKYPLSLDEIKKRLNFLSDTLNISTLKLDTCNKALEIKKKHSLSYWDSLIISSALENQCKYLYSEDLQNEMLIDNKITIINPF